jgi:hypothetical protein
LELITVTIFFLDNLFNSSIIKINKKKGEKDFPL